MGVRCGICLLELRRHLALARDELGFPGQELFLLGEEGLDPLGGALLEALHEPLGHRPVRLPGRSSAAAEQDEDGGDEARGETHAGADLDQPRQLRARRPRTGAAACAVTRIVGSG